MNNFSAETISKLKAFGIYQIVGGLIGIGLTVWLISMQTVISVLIMLMILFALILYSYSIYCGTLLVKQKFYKGLRLSNINQYLQLINFSVLGYGFQYISGAYFTVGVDLTDSFIFKLNFGVSSWQLQFNVGGDLTLINFNIVALLLILFIEKMKKKIEPEQAIETQFSEPLEVR